ncbi:hypothetical protein GCK32_012126, partial [Trichostrongylus colubriformis]
NWLVYTWRIIATVAIILIVVTCSIVVWIVKHKKRLIQQDNDPILTSTYDGEFTWKRCLCCTTPADKQSQLQARQNSASNLDPYRRPPLPPIGAKPGQFICQISYHERRILVLIVRRFYGFAVITEITDLTCFTR